MKDRSSTEIFTRGGVIDATCMENLKENICEQLYETEKLLMKNKIFRITPTSWAFEKSY